MMGFGELLVGCGFTKRMIQNLEKDERDLPKITEGGNMNYTEWMPSEYGLVCNDNHFTIALPQGIVPYHWQLEVENLNMDFPTIKTTLSKVTCH